MTDTHKKDLLYQALLWQTQAGVDLAVGAQALDWCTLGDQNARSGSQRRGPQGAQGGFTQERGGENKENVPSFRQEKNSNLSSFVETQPHYYAPTVQSEEMKRLEDAETHVQQASVLAKSANTLEDLQEAVQMFEGCPLKKYATNTVFSAGNPKSDILLIGEAPGREEDRLGAPFVGPSGKLMDSMLEAAGFDREKLYITNCLFWRPPGNRTPSSAEVAQCLPFVWRHIELFQPKIIALVGGLSAKTLLERSEGITRLRGRWFDMTLPDHQEREGVGQKSDPIPTMAMLHPAFLLRQPQQKKNAWFDWLSFFQKYDEISEKSGNSEETDLKSIAEKKD